MAKFCAKCNYPIEEGGAFCTECGSSEIIDTDNMSTTENPPQEVAGPIPEIVPKKENNFANEIASNLQNKNIVAPVKETPKVEVPGANTTLKPISNIGGVDEEPIQVTTPPVQVEVPENKSSFADVPDFMNGNSETQSTNNIEVPKDMQLQEGGSENEYTHNDVALNDALIARQKAKQKKKNKKTILTVLIVFGVVVVLGFLFTFIFYYGKAVGSMENGPFTNDDVTANGDNSNFDYTSIFTPDNSFRVGKESFGYISIPNTWAQFAQTDGNQTLQYTDGNGWIVTLYALPTSQMTAVDYANSIYKSISTSNVKDLKSSKASISGYSALTITAYYPDQNKYLTTWFFETKSGNTNYLAIEGPSPTGENYNIIYSFKEDK